MMIRGDNKTEFRRTGQVAYSRNYEYNPDGSRYSVSRSDALNGSHWELYLYEEMSGRLESVVDLVSGEVNAFEWNPEGTLGRWGAPNTGYERVFSYDEEGRLVKIERDYGGGNISVAYEYGYNSDGVKVWKKDHLNQQEYRYVCRIGCGGVPMRVYQRAMGNGNWTSVEDYLPAGNALGYNWNWYFRYTGGALVMMGQTGEPYGYYPTDSNGLSVGTAPPVACVCVIFLQEVCAPMGWDDCSGSDSNCPRTYGFRCVPGNCNSSPAPSPPGSPALPDPNDRTVWLLGFPLLALIAQCMANPICRGVLFCLAAALGAAIGNLIGQLLTGTCCNWCRIGCGALCACLTAAAGYAASLLRPILGPLVGAFVGGTCIVCCPIILGCS